MSVASYICRRCGYTTQYKHAFLKHLEKKKVCESILEDINVEDILKTVRPIVKTKSHQCKRCKKQFSHPSGLSRHKKTCVKTDDINEIKERFRQEVIDDVVHDIKNELRREITEELKKNMSNNNVTINNNTYVVVLNNFGAEDVSHIIEDNDFLDKCLSTLQTGIPKVVEKIYYDKSKPENKTVVLKSSKRKTALVHTNGEWIEKHLNQVVPFMVLKGSKILCNHINRKEIPEDNEAQDVFLAKKDFISNVMNSKKPQYDTISSAIHAYVCNHRAINLETESTL